MNPLEQAPMWVMLNIKELSHPTEELLRQLRSELLGDVGNALDHILGLPDIDEGSYPRSLPDLNEAGEACPIEGGSLKDQVMGFL